MMQASSVHLYDTRITGTNDYADTRNSDICVITAGLPRKPGMSRDDLLTKNASIVDSVTRSFVEYSPNAIIIVVSNPLDTMTYTAYRASGFESSRVMGMAGILDTARFRAFIALELGVSVRDIGTMLLGGHGDTMVPLPRYTTVGGTPLTDHMSPDRIDAIVERTKYGGGEIVKLMGTSAWYAPGAAAAEMCEAIVKNNNRVLPCAAWVSGQYGLSDMFIGVPVRLGSSGVQEIFELDLNESERELMKSSGKHVAANLRRLEELVGA
jgi:malate dehydrogenase